MAGFQIRYDGSGGLRNFDDVTGLGSFLALDNFELDLVSFSQALIAFRGNRAVVYEYIRTVFTADKSVTFRVIEPLHSTFQTFHLQSSSVRACGEPRRMPQPG
jgi:hypothetical protein